MHKRYWQRDIGSGLTVESAHLPAFRGTYSLCKAKKAAKWLQETTYTQGQKRTPGWNSKQKPLPGSTNARKQDTSPTENSLFFVSRSTLGALALVVLRIYRAAGIHRMSVPRLGGAVVCRASTPDFVTKLVDFSL